MENKKILQGTVAILGIPFDDNSSLLKGTASAPEEIRKVLHSGVGNWFTEDLTDLKNHTLFYEAGDLTIKDFRSDIRNGVLHYLDREAKVLSLGGDHSITFPVIEAYHSFYPDLSILHFDAHPDLYIEFEGNPYSHACPFSRILESGFVKRVVQIGIRAENLEQRKQVERYKVEQININTVPGEMKLNFDGPVYISLDLDGIDPAYAPAVSHPEPGGLSVRDVLNVIHSLRSPVVGADIVEYNPLRDTYGRTASVAVKLLKEIAGKMIKG